MKNKITISLMVLLFGIVCLFGCCSEVYATGSSGSGGGGGACTKNCGKPRWWGVYPKKHHSGISWKVFKVKRKNGKEYVWKGYKLYRTTYAKGPTYCKSQKKMSSSKNCSTIGSLSNFKYDRELSVKCNKTYDWYAVLAFDGWHEYDTKTVRYFGPSAMGATYKSGSNHLKYYRSNTIQKDGMIDKDTFKTRFKNGKLAEGTRVDTATVKYLCKLADKGKCAGYDGGTLPDGLGYVCIKDPDCTGGCCPGDSGYPTCDDTPPPPENPPDACDKLLKRKSGQVRTGTWVKNTSVAQYNKAWHTGEADPVWAKPTDQISWMNCYDSDIATKRSKMSTVNNVDPPHDPELSGKKNHVVNKKVAKWLSPWTNEWWVTGAGSYYNKFSKKKSVEDEYANKSDVTVAWIGLGTKEISTTGSPTKISISSSEHEWACHWGIVGYHKETTNECIKKDKKGNCTEYKKIDVPDYGYKDTCSHDDKYYFTTAEGPRSALAMVNVPYNYENIAEVEVDSPTNGS